MILSVMHANVYRHSCICNTYGMVCVRMWMLIYMYTIIHYTKLQAYPWEIFKASVGVCTRTSVCLCIFVIILCSNCELIFEEYSLESFHPLENVNCCMHLICVHLWIEIVFYISACLHVCYVCTYVWCVYIYIHIYKCVVRVSLMGCELISHLHNPKRCLRPQFVFSSNAEHMVVHVCWSHCCVYFKLCFFSQCHEHMHVRGSHEFLFKMARVFFFL